MAARRKGMLRHPRTTQEARAEDEYTRAKRRKNNLPQAYDDIFPSEEKSWKRLSKGRKQYKPKDI